MHHGLRGDGPPCTKDKSRGTGNPLTTSTRKVRVLPPPLVHKCRHETDALPLVDVHMPTT